MTSYASVFDYIIYLCSLLATIMYDQLKIYPVKKVPIYYYRKKKKYF